MSEIIRLYTESGDFCKKTEIEKEIEEIKHSDFGTSFEVIATYVTRVDNLNVLVELQVPTMFSEDFGTEMVAYTFDGELEDYMADVELQAKVFNEDWETAVEQMRNFANEVVKDD